jgi:hypothetical protein
LGSSPGIVGGARVAARTGEGLAQSATFQRVLDDLPQDVALVLFLQPKALIELLDANAPVTGWSQGEPGPRGLQAFDAIGAGLYADTHGIHGVITFAIDE